jgi:hypothetical protein
MPIAGSRQRKTVLKISTTSTAAAAPVGNSPASPSDVLGSATPASKPTSAQQQTPRVNSAGMVWVNSDSGVYHKPGARWHGKTKQGTHMTEADDQKAGYLSRGSSGCTEKEIELVVLCVTASRRTEVLIFSRSLFAQDDFAVAHELIVQPQTVLVRGRFVSGARRAAEQPHAGRCLKNIR